MTLPMPSFYEESTVGDIYVERAQEVGDAASAFRQKHAIVPANQDRFRIAAFGIDCQIGFCCPGGSLFVPGAIEDAQRTIGWLYRNLNQITALHFSLDTHRIFQIFHPAFWRDEQGKHPAPFTPISYDDLRCGRYQPIAHPQQCLEYVKSLERAGKYSLTIWPFHTLLGGVSHALLPAMMEASIFHSLTRMHQTHFETKGTHTMTENYSVLSPEVRELGGKPIGAFNSAFFRMLMDYDRIYIFGQAKSHCVLSTLQDIKKEIEATDPTLARKIWILEDAMSPVPAPALDPLPPSLNFPRVANEGIEAFRKAGMHIAKTTDPITY